MSCEQLAKNYVRAKKYKEKLNEWRFVKYVPKEVLQWMLHKAEQRSRADEQYPRGKKTPFEYGSLVLTQNELQKRSSRVSFMTGENADLSKSTSVLAAIS